MKIFAIILCFIGSCESIKTETKNGIEYVTFSKGAFKSSSTVKCERIYFETALNPSYVQFLNDSLMLTMNDDEKFHIGEIYNLNTKKLIKKCIPKGRGVGEILGVLRSSLSYDHKSVLIADCNYHKVAKYDINKMIKEGLKYKPVLNHLPPYIINVAENSKEQIVCKNIYYTFIEKFKNDVFDLAYYKDLDSIDKSGKAPYWAFAINGGKVKINRKNDDIIITFWNRPDIHIYNKELKRIKVLNCSEVKEPRYFRQKDRLFLKESKNIFNSIYVTDKYIYLSFVNNESLEKNQSTEIFKLDLDYNFVHRYKIDKFLKDIYVTSDDKHLYAKCTDYDSYPDFYKVKL